MANSNNTLSSDNPLIQLKAMLERDQATVLGRIRQMFRFSDNNKNSIARFVGLINEGYVPVIYSNHQSHADGVVLSLIIEQIRKDLPKDHLKGFLCPVAASMASGDQNDRVQGGTFLFGPIFEQIGFIYVPIIREDDRRKYGMEGSNQEAIEKLIHAPRDKYGLAVFPEGTVQGGRIREDGKIFGMQKVEGGGILLRCVRFWQDLGRKTVLLPVGVVNSYKTFDPDNYDVPESLLSMLAGESTVEPMVEAVVGEPLTVEEITKALGSAIDAKSQEHADYLMEKIAALLPEEARGFYRI
jgi:hypothetical protein